MDHRNGGDSLAPPRPPKSMSRVLRPRAPEPDTVDSPIIINPIPPPTLHHQPINRININLNNMSNTSSSINSSLNSLTSSSNHHRSIPPIPHATAPLTPLQNNRITIFNNNNNATSTISTFSRRRTEMPQQRIPASSHVSSVTSLTPSLVAVPATTFISTVVGGSLSPVINSMTLQIPRPENERFPNEYVDAPFTNSNKLTTLGSRHSMVSSVGPTVRNQFNSHTTSISIIDGVLNHNNNINNNDDSNKVILPNRTSAAQQSNQLPITKQPSFRSKKDAALHQQFIHCPENSLSNSQNATSSRLNIGNSDQLNSIRCPHCNRCRCEECKRPRQLPSKWFCDNNCFCSAETIIDYASCLCCVKALFYHCSKDHELDCESETIRCAEDPCSCVPYKRATRWGCLSVLSILLPCLCCYWPMRGCVSLCAKCYAKHSRHGCRCNINVSPNSTNNSRQNIINLVSPISQNQPPMYHHYRQSNNNDLTPKRRLLDSLDY